MDISKDFLIRTYFEEGLSTYEITQQYNIPRHKIRYALIKYKLPLRNRGGHNIRNLEGQVFGNLTVIRQTANNNKTGKTSAKWLCSCKCGNQKEILGRSLITGLTKSCGCRLNSSMWKGYGKLSSSYWSRVKIGAKRRRLEFTITMKEAWDKYIEQKQKCALSGVDILIVTNYTLRHSDHTASLDRIDELIS